MIYISKEICITILRNISIFKLKYFEFLGDTWLFSTEKKFAKTWCRIIGCQRFDSVLKQKQCKCTSVHAHVPLSKATLFWEQLSVLKKFSFACDWFKSAVDIFCCSSLCFGQEYKENVKLNGQGHICNKLPIVFFF